jgi:hypothetical protein
MTLKEQIVTEIMSLVRPQPQKMEPKPTIAELEKILNSECTDAISIEPDGSVCVRPTSTTVGAVADKVIGLVEGAIAAERERCMAIVSRARNGEIDGDLRCLLSRMKYGKPADED